LDFDPGTRFAYSNFGYCLLGRVIEKVSGQNYERFIQDAVLKPAGAVRTKLGKTLTPADGESRYYMSATAKEGPVGHSVFPNVADNVPWPYGGWSLEMMDSHGGWISTAEDLVRFGSALHGGQQRSPFRQEKSALLLAIPPPGKPGLDDNGEKRPSYYGCGFSVKNTPAGKTISHSGSLSGTSSFIFIRPDGLTWAALFNQREDSGPKDSAIAKTINAILDKA
jgi:CubicO group peptidase (beta-lactamase class C family)